MRWMPITLRRRSLTEYLLFFCPNPRVPKLIRYRWNKRKNYCAAKIHPQLFLRMDFFYRKQLNYYCLNFCEKSLLRWRIVVNLAPCSCAGAVEYIVHSCSVLVAKPDLVARCIHRLDQSRILPACKSLLHWRTCSAGCGVSRCSVVAAQSTLF